MNVEVIVNDLENNPQCLHGPTLLFKRNGTKPKQYYACSASRDRKECPVYIHAEYKSRESSKASKWIAIRKETVQNIISKNSYGKFLKILKSFQISTKQSQKKLLSSPIGYCYSCEELFDQVAHHKECNVIENLSEYHLKHPTEILTPKEDSKTHAQYFFTKDTVKNIVLILSQLGTKRILCIGTPRIHENICNEHKNIESLLLDIDVKYYNFYDQKKFIWYNMFNNCVLKEDSLKTLKEFLCFDNVAVIMDPPFGGRVEPLAYTVNSLNRIYREVNSFDIEGDTPNLNFFWIFPYFMEKHIKASLPNFNMFDLKIDYDNHSSFTNTGNRRRKFGSPVRIFTNVLLSVLNLDGIDGYRYCESCKFWVAEENLHCDDCGACTSKSGRTYVHCFLCGRCVKPSYQHCRLCKICTLPDHVCNKIITEHCFHCKMPGHKKRNCPEAEGMIIKKKKRRRD